MPGSRRRVRQAKRLVIDASVVRASGGEGATFPTSKYCRDFLSTVLKVCHRAAMTPQLRAEWKRHMSRFARKWRVRMEGGKKVEHLSVPRNDLLRNRLDEVIGNPARRDAALKDMHLIEAALATDRLVASLDETARAILSSAAPELRDLAAILWVNPSRPDERVISWLENGAPAQESRRLRASSSAT